MKDPDLIEQPIRSTTPKLPPDNNINSTPKISLTESPPKNYLESTKNRKFAGIHSTHYGSPGLLKGGSSVKFCSPPNNMNSKKTIKINNSFQFELLKELVPSDNTKIKLRRSTAAHKPNKAYKLKIFKHKMKKKILNNEKFYFERKLSLFLNSDEILNKKRQQKEEKKILEEKIKNLDKKFSETYQTELRKIPLINPFKVPLYWLNLFCIIIVAYFIGFVIFNREESLNCGELKKDIGERHYLMSIFNYKHLRDLRNYKFSIDDFQYQIMPIALLAFYQDTSLFEKNHYFETINASCKYPLKMNKIMSKIFPIEKIIKKKNNPDKQKFIYLPEVDTLGTGIETNGLTWANHIFNQYLTTRLVTNIQVEFQEELFKTGKNGRIRRNGNFKKREKLNGIPLKFSNNTKSHVFYSAPYQTSPEVFLKNFKKVLDEVLKPSSFSFFQLKFSYLNLGTMHLGTQQITASYHTEKLLNIDTKFACTPPHTTRASSYRFWVLFLGFFVLVIDFLYYCSILGSSINNIRAYFRSRKIENENKLKNLKSLKTLAFQRRATLKFYKGPIQKLQNKSRFSQNLNKQGLTKKKIEDITKENKSLVYNNLEEKSLNTEKTNKNFIGQA